MFFKNSFCSKGPVLRLWIYTYFMYRTVQCLAGCRDSNPNCCDCSHAHPQPDIRYQRPHRNKINLVYGNCRQYTQFEIGKSQHLTYVYIINHKQNNDGHLPSNNDGVVVVGNTVQDVLKKKWRRAQVVHATIEETLRLLEL